MSKAAGRWFWMSFDSKLKLSFFCSFFFLCQHFFFSYQKLLLSNKFYQHVCDTDRSLLKWVNFRVRREKDSSREPSIHLLFEQNLLLFNKQPKISTLFTFGIIVLTLIRYSWTHPLCSNRFFVVSKFSNIPKSLRKIEVLLLFFVSYLTELAKFFHNFYQPILWNFLHTIAVF